MTYVDGFVLPVPTRRIPAYRKLARLAARVWIEHGALHYHECVGDDMAVHCGRSFVDQLQSKRGETVVFAFIVYRSRAQRDRVNKKVMEDPRMQDVPKLMPFDVGRMCWGGFKTLVSAQAD